MVYEPNTNDAIQALDDYVLNKKDRGFGVIAPGDGVGAGAYAVTVNTGNLDASDTLSVGSASDEALFDGNVVSLSAATDVQINSVSAATDGTEQYRYDVIWIDSSGEVNKTEGSVTRLTDTEKTNTLSRFERFVGDIPKPGTVPATVVAAVIVNSDDTGVSTSQLKDYRVDAKTQNDLTQTNELNGGITGSNSLTDLFGSGIEFASNTLQAALGDGLDFDSGNIQILDAIWDAANTELIADVNNTNTNADNLTANSDFVDPAAVSHTGEIADLADVSSIQSSSDVTIEDTTTAGGDGTVPTSQGDGTIQMQTPGGNVPNWQEDSASPFSFSDSATSQVTLGSSYDFVKVFIEIKPASGTSASVSLQVNGDTGTNYDQINIDASTTTGRSDWLLADGLDESVDRAVTGELFFDAAAQTTLFYNQLAFDDREFTTGLCDRGGNENTTGSLSSFTVQSSGGGFNITGRVYGLNL